MHDPILVNPFETEGFEKLPQAEREAVLTAMMRKLFDNGELLEAVSGRQPKQKRQTKTRKKPAKGGWVYVGPPKEKEISPRKSAVAARKERRIYRLVVDIVGYPPFADDFMATHPDIVREIEIAGDQTLDKLHATIFKAFDREEEHGYEFQLSKKRMDRAAPRYAHPQLLDEDPDDELLHNAAATTLDELGLTVGQKFHYWFDFGDDWWHGITVKGIDAPEPRRKYPRVAGKRGNSPAQYPEW